MCLYVLALTCHFAGLHVFVDRIFFFFLMLLTHFSPFIPKVSTLFEERCQQAADHAPAKEKVQESYNPGVQDSRIGSD